MYHYKILCLRIHVNLNSFLVRLLPSFQFSHKLFTSVVLKCLLTGMWQSQQMYLFSLSQLLTIYQPCCSLDFVVFLRHLSLFSLPKNIGVRDEYWVSIFVFAMYICDIHYNLMMAQAVGDPDEPECGKDQILIKLSSVSLNPVDSQKGMAHVNLPDAIGRDY